MINTAAQTVQIDLTTVLNIVGGLLVTVLTAIVSIAIWFLKKLAADVRKIEVQLPEKYVRKDDFHTALNDIKSSLDKIFNKLDGKVDKGS
jgi:hypothetical protein